VPEARLSDPRPVFKCTRCNHVFSRGERAPGRASGRARGDSRNLAFPFAAADAGAAGPESEAEAARSGAHEIDDEEDERLGDDGPDEEPGDDRADAAEDEDDEPEREPPAIVRRAEHAAPAREEPAPPRRPPPPARSADPVAPAEHGRDDPAFVADLARGGEKRAARDERDKGSRGLRSGAAARPGRERDAEEEDDAPGVDDEGPLLITERGRAQRSPIQPRRRGGEADVGRSPLKPIAVGVAAVVLAFLALAVVLWRRPELAFERLASVPLLGRLLGDDHLLVWRLQITGVESSVDRIKGDRPALVVSGQVLNTTSQSLRVVEVEGRLIADGVERRRQVVYAANQSRKTLRDLSSSEVEMLLRLEPNRRFVVRPGESVGFLIVFSDPPPNTSGVTCRVLDARPA
jgi:hypothetical protein